MYVTPRYSRMLWVPIGEDEVSSASSLSGESATTGWLLRVAFPGSISARVLSWGGKNALEGHIPLPA